MSHCIALGCKSLSASKGFPGFVIESRKGENEDYLQNQVDRENCSPKLPNPQIKCLRASCWLNWSKTDLARDLPMVCKFKFVRYVHIKKKWCFKVVKENQNTIQQELFPIRSNQA